jgi:hypothetical protein
MKFRLSASNFAFVSGPFSAGVSALIHGLLGALDRLNCNSTDLVGLRTMATDELFRMAPISIKTIRWNGER